MRLAGLTNLNYRIGDFVLRLPGAGTSEYIDRHAEEVAARSASDAGVNAELLHFDAGDGLMVTRFVDGARTMSGEGFAADLGAVERAGRALRRLHTTAAPFAIEFRLFDMIDEYKALLAAKSAVLPDGYEQVQAEAEAARAALTANPVPLAPCHCDPLCENFLDTGDTMYVIDYEYAGNNDPMWDLGDLSVEGGFGARAGRRPARRLLRRSATRGGSGPNGDPQGDVRSVVDPVGRDPTRQRQPRRRLLGIRRRPLRALPDTDGKRALPSVAVARTVPTRM